MHCSLIKSYFLRILSVLIVLFTCAGLPVQAEKNTPLPIVLVHGIMSDKYGMQSTQDYIKKYLPNVYVKNVHIGLGKFTSYLSSNFMVRQHLYFSA